MTAIGWRVATFGATSSPVRGAATGVGVGIGVGVGVGVGMGVGVGTGVGDGESVGAGVAVAAAIGGGLTVVRPTAPLATSPMPAAPATARTATTSATAQRFGVIELPTGRFPHQSRGRSPNSDGRRNAGAGYRSRRF